MADSQGSSDFSDRMKATVNDMKVPPAVELLEISNVTDEQSQTFIFGNEDHTLGNALRHVLMQNPKVDFCGYSVPHPYEPKMNMRLQTRTGAAPEVMMEGLEDLGKSCDMINDAFDKAVEDFENQRK